MATQNDSDEDEEHTNMALMEEVYSDSNNKYVDEEIVVLFYLSRNYYKYVK